MFGFILRFFKGLILGWLMSLFFFLIRRLLARALGGDAFPNGVGGQHRRSPQSPQSQSAPERPDFIETIWVGMTARQLKAAFGEPIRIEQGPMDELWYYENINGRGILTAIEIGGGHVKGWRNQTPEIIESAGQ